MVVPETILPPSSWPIVLPDDLKEAKRFSFSSETPLSDIVDSAPLWEDSLNEGENVLLYSINSARMRILKNKISIRELRRYVFSRQVHFLAQQLKGKAGHRKDINLMLVKNALFI